MGIMSNEEEIAHPLPPAQHRRNRGVSGFREISVAGVGTRLVNLGIAIANRSAAKTKPIKEPRALRALALRGCARYGGTFKKNDKKLIKKVPKRAPSPPKT